MIKIAFSLLLLVHGSIHFIGFAKAFGYIEVQQFTHDIPPAKGIVWLVAGVMLLFSLVLFLFKAEWWWASGVISLALSQALIIQHWHDAKFGTIANGLLAIACILGYGAWSFQRMATREVDALLPKNIHTPVVTASDIAALPPIVQRWLTHTGVVGREAAHVAHVHQQGEMRLTPDGAWMPVRAEQWFTTQTPGFLWLADVGSGSFMQFAGRDTYHSKHGNMLIKLFSLFPIVDATGAEIDQGSLARYLAEIIWFPSVAINKSIAWEEVDSLRARATIKDGATVVSGIFEFTAEGKVTSFETQRYYSHDGGATLERWFIDIDSESERMFSGLRIPVKASVTWKLATGDFTWYKLEITKAEYNGHTGA